MKNINLVGWLRNWFYTKEEIDLLLQNHQPSTPVVSKILLTTDKPILSHYDNDSCTLTATLLDSNNNGVSGEEIVFKANSELLTTVITNDNGVAQCTYQSTGVGDVTITAECMNLTKTLSIEDCFYANLPEQSISNSSITVYSALCTGIEDIMDSNFVLEFDINSISGNGGGLNIGAKSQYTPPSTANYRIFVGIDGTKFNLNNRSSTSSPTNGSTISTNTYYHMELVKNGGTFSASVDNDSAFGSKTPNWISNYPEYDLYIIGWTNANMKIKNIKIKPL